MSCGPWRCRGLRTRRRKARGGAFRGKLGRLHQRFRPPACHWADWTVRAGRPFSIGLRPRPGSIRLLAGLNTLHVLRFLLHRHGTCSKIARWRAIIRMALARKLRATRPATQATRKLSSSNAETNCEGRETDAWGQFHGYWPVASIPVSQATSCGAIRIGCSQWPAGGRAP